MTINKFLEFLDDAIKERALIIKTNESIVDKFYKEEELSQKMELMRLNEKIASEQQDMITLYNKIIDFYLVNQEKLKLTIENRNCKKLNNLSKYFEPNFDLENKTKKNISMQENETKSMEELYDLLQYNISEENYEECAKIQILINIKTKNR